MPKLLKRWETKMNVDIAVEKAVELINKYPAKLEKFGLVAKRTNLYEKDNYIDECEYESKDLRHVSIDLEVRTPDMSDDDGIVYGIMFDVDKNREVDEEEFNNIMNEEELTLDDLVAALNNKEDPIAFFKEEAASVKEEGEQMLKEMKKSLNRFDIVLKTMLIVLGASACIALACFLLFG
jgi:hypothetical protein